MCICRGRVIDCGFGTVKRLICLDGPSYTWAMCCKCHICELPAGTPGNIMGIVNRLSPYDDRPSDDHCPNCLEIGPRNWPVDACQRPEIKTSTSQIYWPGVVWPGQHNDGVFKFWDIPRMSIMDRGDHTLYNPHGFDDPAKTILSTDKHAEAMRKEDEVIKLGFERMLHIDTDHLEGAGREPEMGMDDEDKVLMRVDIERQRNDPLHEERKTKDKSTKFKIRKVFKR